MDHVDDGKIALAVEIDVENGEVEFFLVSTAHGFVEGGRFRRDLVPDVLQHVGEHHADHGFAFDDQRAARRQGGRCKLQNQTAMPYGRRRARTEIRLNRSTKGRRSGSCDDSMSRNREGEISCGQNVVFQPLSGGSSLDAD